MLLAVAGPFPEQFIFALAYLSSCCYMERRQRARPADDYQNISRARYDPLGIDQKRVWTFKAFAWIDTWCLPFRVLAIMSNAGVFTPSELCSDTTSPKR